MPGARAARVEAVARDDAGDVRAVAVVVVRRRPAVDEIDEVDRRAARRRSPARSSCHAVTPESITATPTPVPS